MASFILVNKTLNSFFFLKFPSGVTPWHLRILKPS